MTIQISLLDRPLLFLFITHVVLLFLSPATAQPSSDSNNDYNAYGNNINPSIGIVIIVLVVSLFLLGFFSMYVRHCAGDSSDNSIIRLTAAQAGARPRVAPRGLDSTVIESFPTFDYASVKSLKIGKATLECAVCLNEFQDDETLRLIPKCDHVFHPDCIDAWLVSHTTCPVCRADLTPQPGESIHGPQLGQQAQNDQPNNIDGDDVHIDVVGQPAEPPVQCETESMERPLNYPGLLPPSVPRLNRSRTRRNGSGRPKWFGMFPRSNSTGHVAVTQWENHERFTLRVPEEVRREIISGKLNRTTSCVALPREASSRRGPRVGPIGPSGEGSSRGRLFGSWRFDRAARSDRWMFSLAPPFVSRAPSVRSTKAATPAAGDGGSVHSSKTADSVHVFTVSEPNLPPV